MIARHVATLPFGEGVTRQCRSKNTFHADAVVVEREASTVYLFGRVASTRSLTYGGWLGLPNDPAHLRELAAVLERLAAEHEERP